MSVPSYGEPLLLITVEAIKAMLGITVTTYDDQLTKAAPIVTEMFETYCYRGLAYSASVVEEVQVERRIPLFRFPLEAVTSWTVDGVEQTVPPTLDLTRGFMLTDFHSPTNALAMVTYSGGFLQTGVPHDLAMAYSQVTATYAGVPYTVGGSSSGGAPLKSLSLGSGALAVSFETGSASENTYDASDAPTLLQPHAFTLRRYRVPYV